MSHLNLFLIFVPLGIVIIVVGGAAIERFHRRDEEDVRKTHGTVDISYDPSVYDVPKDILQAAVNEFFKHYCHDNDLEEFTSHGLTFHRASRQRYKLARAS